MSNKREINNSNKNTEKRNDRMSVIPKRPVQKPIPKKGVKK